MSELTQQQVCQLWYIICHPSPSSNKYSNCATLSYSPSPPSNKYSYCATSGYSPLPPSNKYSYCTTLSYSPSPPSNKYASCGTLSVIHHHQQHVLNGASPKRLRPKIHGDPRVSWPWSLLSTLYSPEASLSGDFLSRNAFSELSHAEWQSVSISHLETSCPEIPSLSCFMLNDRVSP